MYYPVILTGQSKLFYLADVLNVNLFCLIMLPSLSPCGDAYRSQINPYMTFGPHLFCMPPNVIVKQTSSEKRNHKVKVMMDIVALLVRGFSLWFHGCGGSDVGYYLLLVVSVMGDLYTISISGLSGILENREWVGVCLCSVVADPFPASLSKARLLHVPIQDCHVW